MVRATLYGSNLITTMSFPTVFTRRYTWAGWLIPACNRNLLRGTQLKLPHHKKNYDLDCDLVYHSNDKEQSAHDQLPHSQRPFTHLPLIA